MQRMFFGVRGTKNWMASLRMQKFPDPYLWLPGRGPSPSLDHKDWPSCWKMMWHGRSLSVCVCVCHNTPPLILQGSCRKSIGFFWAHVWSHTSCHVNRQSPVTGQRQSSVCFRLIMDISQMEWIYGSHAVKVNKYVKVHILMLVVKASSLSAILLLFYVIYFARECGWVRYDALSLFPSKCFNDFF